MEIQVKKDSVIRKQWPGHIYNITDNHSPSHPGVTAVVTQLTRYLARQGWPTTILAAGAALTAAAEGVQLVEFPLRQGGQSWRYPVKMGDYFKGLNAHSGSLFHLHGVWGAPQWLAARAAVRQGIPSVLTIYDMLSPWHWQQGCLHYLKKMIYWYTMAYPAFRHLTIIHAITPKERDCLTRQFPRNRLELIPNALDLEEVDSQLAASQRIPSQANNCPYLLFLGRLHPQKGVDILINAFARSNKGQNFRLVIIGSDFTPEYTAKLKSQVRLLGIEKQVTFLGPIFGLQKWRLYQDAWAGCLPSRSDSISITSLEFASASTPTVTTHESGLFDWEEGGGILVQPQVEQVSQALEQVFSWSETERRARGIQSRQLVERRYSWQAVGPLWLELYSRLIEQ